jgi:hypothetical protein
MEVRFMLRKMVTLLGLVIFAASLSFGQTYDCQGTYSGSNQSTGVAVSAVADGWFPTCYSHITSLGLVLYNSTSTAKTVWAQVYIGPAGSECTGNPAWQEPMTVAANSTLTLNLENQAIGNGKNNSSGTYGFCVEFTSGATGLTEAVNFSAQNTVN